MLMARERGPDRVCGGAAVVVRCVVRRDAERGSASSWSRHAEHAYNVAGTLPRAVASCLVGAGREIESPSRGFLVAERYGHQPLARERPVSGRVSPAEHATPLCPAPLGPTPLGRLRFRTGDRQTVEEADLRPRPTRQRGSTARLGLCGSTVRLGRFGSLLTRRVGIVQRTACAHRLISNRALRPACSAVNLAGRHGR